MDRTGASDLAGLQNAKKKNGKYCYIANIVLQVTRMLQEQWHKSCIRSAYGRQSNSFHSSYFFQTIKILLQNLLQNTPTKYYGFFQNLKKKYIVAFSKISGVNIFY